MTGGWLHTGDMAVWDEDGYVQIVDRKKDIIVSGGENVSSLEVERAIFAHRSVLECAVVSKPDEKWGEVPAAYVVLKPGHSLDEPRFARLPGRPHRPLQDAAPVPVRNRSASQDRHGEDSQARTPRSFLGGTQAARAGVAPGCLTA